MYYNGQFNYSFQFIVYRQSQGIWTKLKTKTYSLFTCLRSNTIKLPHMRSHDTGQLTTDTNFKTCKINKFYTSSSDRTFRASEVLRLWYRTLFSYHLSVIPNFRSIVWVNSDMASTFFSCIDTLIFAGIRELSLVIVKGGTFLL